MAAPLEGLPVGPASLVALIAAIAFAAGVLFRLEAGNRLGAALRRRFVLGLPWGTVIVVGFVLSVYLIVQGAWGRLDDPVVVGFRAWSYRYLEGMVLAPFAHNGLGHVTGNLLGTVVFAPIAEYAWSHYPTARGSESFSGLRSNPYARIAGFAVGVVLVGLATSLFVPGPLIGFSGVVFAFAGFAIVTRPLLAVFAIVGSRVVDLVYYTALNPVITATAEPRFVSPWWADVAVQAHALGLLLGVLLGVWLVVDRNASPRARYVWFAALVFAVAQSMYAIYWQFGADTFVMFRAAGVALVILLATAVMYATASDRNLLARDHLNRRQVAAGLLLAVVLAIGGAALPYNLADVDDRPDGLGIEVRDYTVTYVEDVPNGYVNAVSLPFVGTNLTQGVTASGVVVTSDRRDAWMEVISTGRLAFQGRRSVTVGGPGWRAAVVANRSTWNAVDAGDTYKVYLGRPGEDQRLAFRDDPVRLAPRVAGVNLSIEPTESGFRLNATRNGTVAGRTPVPAVNQSVDLAGLTIERPGNELFAVHDGTRIRVAVFQAGREQGRLRA